MTSMKILRPNTRQLGVPRPIAQLVDFAALDEVWTLGGQSLSGKLTTLELDVTDDDPAEAPAGLTDFLFPLGLTVVSAKAQTSLGRFHADIEFLPIAVRYNGQRLLNQFFVAN